MKNKKKLIIILIFILITVIRFLLSYNLSSLYIPNLNYDDKIMVSQMTSLLNGEYLGKYTDTTLVKGIMFPLILYIANIIKISYSTLLTILYILAVIYFIKPFEKIIRNKYFMFIFYIILLFNPVTYSQELFQRLYRNSLSIIEILFFLGATVRILISNEKTKKNIINYVFLGIITSIMYLTREDNIWTKLILLFIIIYKLIVHKNYKSILITLIPIIVLTINLNIVSYINYKHYNIYTYNEIQKSEFKKTFRKILQIKDDTKQDKVSIPRTTFFKIIYNTETFNITKREINQYYKVLIDDTGEIYNGNIVWYFRQFVQKKNKFEDGKEEQEYYKKLGEELDLAYKEGRLQKELAFSSILLNMPTMNEVINMPKNMIRIINFTTTYKNVKTITDFSDFKYDEEVNAYKIVCLDSHATENIVENNDTTYEIIRKIYMLMAIILSPIAVIIYLINIKRKDIYNLITTIILFIYLIILAGVTYTDATAFPTMRYLCLGNLYILQSIFIVLNMYRLYNGRSDIKIRNIKKRLTKKVSKK